MRTSQLRLFLWLALTFFLSGCAVNTTMNTYALNGICPTPPCCGATPSTLLVAETKAAAGYESEQMLYVDCPFRVRAFSQNKWIAPPNEMLTTQIAQRLQNTCFFKGVVVPPFVGKIDYRLETRLEKLHQDFTCCPSRIHMILHATLINNLNNRVMGEQTFVVTVCARKESPYGGVLAANKATHILLDRLANFVIYTVRCHPCEFVREPAPIVIEESITLPRPNRYM